MTPEEYTERLGDLYGLISGDLAEDAIVPAGLELLAAIKLRISQEGKNSADGNIGDYSTKPIYVQPQQFANAGSFRPQGKPRAKGAKYVQTRKAFTIGLKPTKESTRGRAQFTQVKNDYSSYKSMYLAEGYRELRDVQGLRTDIINFSYRGDLLQDYQLQKISQYVVLGMTTEKSALIRGGLERRFGPVFYATEQEIQAYTSRATYLITRLTRGILSNEGLQAIPVIE